MNMIIICALFAFLTLVAILNRQFLGEQIETQTRLINTEIDLLTEEIQKVRQDVQDIKSTLSNADSPNQEEDKMQKVVGAISNDVKAIYYEMTKFSKAYHV